jgi:hypothetical protein
MRSGYAADTRNPAASSTSPSYDGAAYARQVRDAVLEGLTTNEYQRPATFADMCQTTVSWACAIAKIESESPGSVKVTLARPRMSGCRVGMDPSAPRTRSVAASRSMSTTSLRLAESRRCTRSTSIGRMASLHTCRRRHLGSDAHDCKCALDGGREPPIHAGRVPKRV